MNRTKTSLLSAWVLVAVAWSVAPSIAQTPAAAAQSSEIRNSFVRLGSGVPGVLYEPVNPGPKSAVAVFVMHAESDYLQMSACTELSKRGYRVLCANNSASKSGSNNDVDADRVFLDAKLGVDWLRKQSNIRKIVILGHSGGGALMSGYQSIAESGVKVCQSPDMLLKCPDNLAGLPAADGLMLLDANYGMSGMALLSLDPAVIDESSGLKLNPKLDLFNPQNGFNPQGSQYSDAFIRRFQAAVGRRQNRLIEAAQQRLQKIKAGQGRFSDDESFVVAGSNYLGFNNKLFPQDTRLLSHTRNAWPLLHKDGAMTTEIVHSVRPAAGGSSSTASMERAALKTTVKKYLSTFAIRVNDDFAYGADFIRGVDWLSSYTTPIGNVQSIHAPLLTMGMTGSYEYLAAELIYEHAASADKTIAFVEGATHVFSTCTKCEREPGQFGDTMETLYDYVDGWLSKPGRFLN